MTENEAIKELETNIDLPFGFTVSDEASEIAIQALEEIQQYRAIGTIDEFKALKEKSVAKKVKEIHCDEYYCPTCGSENNCSDTHTVGDKFCPECGQALET